MCVIIPIFISWMNKLSCVTCPLPFLMQSLRKEKRSQQMRYYSSRVLKIKHFLSYFLEYFLLKNSFVMFKTNTEKQIIKYHNGFPRKRKEGDK